MRFYAALGMTATKRWFVRSGRPSAKPLFAALRLTEYESAQKNTPAPSFAHRPLMKRLLLLVLLLVCTFTGFAAAPEWKVGLASVKITPEKPLMLAGYAARTRPFDKI